MVYLVFIDGLCRSPSTVCFLDNVDDKEPSSPVNVSGFALEEWTQQDSMILVG